MAGECGRRSESHCMTPFPLNSITCAKNLKLFENRQNKSPRRIARAKQLRLEGESGADAKRAHRNIVVRRFAVAEVTEEGRRVARIHRTLPPKAANLQTGINRIVLRHLALERLILGALGGSPRIVGCPVGGGDDFGAAERKACRRSPSRWFPCSRCRRRRRCS